MSLEQLTVLHANNDVCWACVPAAFGRSSCLWYSSQSAPKWATARYMPANYHNQVSRILSENLQGKIIGPHCSQWASELYYMSYIAGHRAWALGRREMAGERPLAPWRPGVEGPPNLLCWRSQRLMRAVQALLARVQWCLWKLQTQDRRFNLIGLESVHVSIFWMRKLRPRGDKWCAQSPSRNLKPVSRFLPSPVLFLLCHQFFSFWENLCQSPQKTTYVITIIPSFCICWQSGRKIGPYQVVNCRVWSKRLVGSGKQEDETTWRFIIAGNHHQSKSSD